MNRVDKFSQAPDASFHKDDEGLIDIGAMLQTVWRGRWLVGTCVLAVMFGGWIYAEKIETPVYRATAVVIMQGQTENLLDLESVIGSLGTDGVSLNSEIEVLKSRKLLAQVVERLNLTNDPEFNAALRPPSTRTRIRRWVAGLFSDQRPTEQPIEQTETAEVQNLNRTSGALLRALEVTNVPRSRVFEITISSEDPLKAARIADAYVDEYITGQLEIKFAASERASAWLSERVADLRVELENSESRINAFSASTDLISPEVLLIQEQQLKDTRARIESLREAVDADVELLGKLQNANTEKEKINISQDSQLIRLFEDLEEPGIKEEFDQKFSQIVNRLQSDIETQNDRISTLQRSAQDLADTVNRLNSDLIELQQLRREAEASRLLYEYFLSRLKEVSAQQGIQQADSRVLSSAVIPGAPSTPRVNLVIVASALLGGLLGVAIVLLREAQVNTFRNSRELETETGYTLLGQIPLVPARERQNVSKYLQNKPASAAAEAIRNLRTSIQMSNTKNSSQVIAITSSMPGEGKTTMSMALAQNFAGLPNRKVLLVEGDIRRRIFNRYMSHSRERGLISLIHGTSTLEQSVVRDEQLKVDVLQADHYDGNAADLFATQSFSDTIKSLRDHYDTIIIDTPPVLVVPDARLVARAVDSMLLVVAWDRTSHAQVQEALKMFTSIDFSVSGLILNQIDPHKIKQYGYGDQYGAYGGYGTSYYNN